MALQAAQHEAVHNKTGSDLDRLKVSASLYIYVLKNNKVNITKKMVMMK